MIARLETRRFLGIVMIAAIMYSLWLSRGPDIGAAAQTTMDEFGCPQSVPALSGLKFDDSQHRLWYRRFWTGVCDGLPLFSCFSGRPYWTETMRRILQKLPQASHDSTQTRMCALGKLVGYEWAKDNNVRKIDTQLVSRWIARLESATEPVSELAAIESEAKEKLARR